MRVSLTRSAAQVTLDEIIAGGTCEPISLGDFEVYLLYKQHCVEYLRFVVWFQSYQQRFFALPQHLQKLSPSVNTHGGSSSGCGDGRGLDFKLPTPARMARYVSRASEATSIAAPSFMGMDPGTLIGLYTASSRATTVVPAVAVPSTTAVATQRSADTSKQPFRFECAAAANTFLTPSDTRAPFTDAEPHCHILDVPAPLLASVLENLATTTHPSVFEPIYELAYMTLTISSLPFFLADATKNINREKAIYWHIVGCAVFLLGWAVVVGCLFIHYGHHGDGGDKSVRRRAWRLFGIPFIVLGGMQMYSAHRGFCSEVWSRRATQLRPWELSIVMDERSPSVPGNACPAEGDKAEAAHVLESNEKVVIAEVETVERQRASEGDRSLSSLKFACPPHADDFELDIEYPGPVRLGSSSSAPPSTLEFSQDIKKPKKVPPPIAAPSPSFRHSWNTLLTPSQSETGSATPMTPRSPWTPTSPSSRPMLQQSPRFPHFAATTTSRRQSPKPHPANAEGQDLQLPASLTFRTRMFGPERPVLDPRIRTAHRRVMRDLMYFGFVWGVVWTAVVCAVPWA